MLEHNDDDPMCDKLDKLFYFYVTDCEDPLLLVYSSLLSTAFIEQGYNRYYAQVIRGCERWLPAWIVSDQELSYNVSNDLKIHWQRRVEVFDTATAQNFLTLDRRWGRNEKVPDIGPLIGTRRSDFSFTLASQEVLAKARRGCLTFGHRTLTINGTAPGQAVTVNIKDYDSVSQAIRSLFDQCRAG